MTIVVLPTTTVTEILEAQREREREREGGMMGSNSPNINRGYIEFHVAFFSITLIEFAPKK